MDIIEATQVEMARIRDTISTTKALLPDRNVNFICYEMMINEAEKAIREQDTVKLIKLYQELKNIG